MRYLVIIFLLATSCHSAHKSEDELQEKVEKTILSDKDSSGYTGMDFRSAKYKVLLGTMTVDSSYDKITTELVNEFIDSASTRREITRTIKEKGQKRIEQSSTTIKSDSASKKVNQGASVLQHKQQDSSVTTSIKQKDIKRASFLPWWIWLIALAVAGLVCWKRNSIINLFTK